MSQREAVCGRKVNMSQREEKLWEGSKHVTKRGSLWKEG